MDLPSGKKDAERHALKTLMSTEAGKMIGINKPHIRRVFLYGEWYWACAKRGWMGAGYGSKPEKAYDDWKKWFDRGIDRGL
jgi:hypothetical protein